MWAITRATSPRCGARWLSGISGTESVSHPILLCPTGRECAQGIKLWEKARPRLYSQLNLTKCIPYVAMTQTPFVNREREVVELALQNAMFIHAIKGTTRVSNWRNHHFVFAAQMYGAGKTRIGEEFVKQLNVLLQTKEVVFQEYCPENARPYFDDLLPIVREFCNAEYVHFDLAQIKNYQDFIKTSDVVVPGGFDFLSKYILKKCSEATRPIFFHFDEIGNFDVKSLRELRDQCWYAIRFVNKEQPSFPFFFFSGRGAAYDKLGLRGSPVSSHWLILEPLKADHVKKVLDESTWGPDSSKFTFHRDLNGDQLNALVECMINWTGGAPRQLLYVSHMLEELTDTNGDNMLKSEEGLKEVFKLLLKCVYENLHLKRELGPVSPISGEELSDLEVKAYNHFISSSWLEREVDVNLKVPFADNIQGSTFLTSFNIFAKLQPSGLVKLVAPEFVSGIMQKDTGNVIIDSVSLLHKDIPTLLEFGIPEFGLVWQKIQKISLNPVLFPFMLRDGGVDCVPTKKIKLNLWNSRGPVIRADGALTKLQIEDIVKKKSVGDNTELLPHSLLRFFVDKLEIGDMVVTGKKSSAADVIVKIGPKEVVEFQCKSGAKKIRSSLLEVELKKSVVSKCGFAGYKTNFVLVCASGIAGHVEPKRNMKLFIPTEDELKKFFGANTLSLFQTHFFLS